MTAAVLPSLSLSLSLDRSDRPDVDRAVERAETAVLGAFAGPRSVR